MEKQKIFKISQTEKSDNISVISQNSDSFSTQKTLFSSNYKQNLINKTKEFSASKHINKKFLLLKKELKLNNKLRKIQIDSLLKKCKSKFFKCLYNQLKINYKEKFPKFSQEFITNIRIDINKQFLNKTIIEIYKETNFEFNPENFFLNDNNIENINKKQSLIIFLNLKLYEIYEYYLNSINYYDDYLFILKKDGKNFAILFNFMCHNFIKYYLESKKINNLISNINFNKISFNKRLNQKNRMFQITKKF
jgi:hypothetical protein